ESFLPMARNNASRQFGLPGAYFPHSAYPVPSTVNPYPAPPWGYEICETPWTVQSLWWEYKYTLDPEYLRRVYPLLRAAADFLVAFVTKGDDGKYHIVPTVSPENWGATVDFRLNKDCIIDLALTEFLLDAMLEGSKALDLDADLRPKWHEVRTNLAPYPEVTGPFGRVWTDVANGPAEFVYNVPVTLAAVFPAEQIGLDRRPADLELARRTARTIRLEGGNDLVWQPLVRARLAMLDLEWFKREVRYCLGPFGVANDRVRQIDGRYKDDTPFDFMMRMGVWTENLSLPAVLNECMLQSCAGVIRLFPNTENLGHASFRDLRAAGAFLVSAVWDGKAVSAVTIKSEKGAPARLAKPWPTLAVESGGKGVPFKELDGIVEFATQPGAVYAIRQAT
ncbi:MAG: glycoside hydrolase family 95-like protein, partial [Bryobacteraceae bacterium]